MFAGLHENKVVLRLGDEDREGLIRDHRAKAFEPLPGRVMKDWLVLPARVTRDRSGLASWVERALTISSRNVGS